MKNKINLVELLKDCPKGMELDCVMCDNIYFDKINEDCRYPIGCYTIYEEIRTSINFTEYGTFNIHGNSKCVIFPKGKTTWEGFIPPVEFKDGDVIISFLGDIHLLRTRNSSYCAYRWRNAELDSTLTTGITVVRLATEDEKQKLFDAIKNSGYKWNEETKTLEKLIEPKFKVGDRIKHKTHIEQENVVTEIKDTHYSLDDETALPFVFQDEYELVPNKFDISTLKSFDSKVLVRNVGAWEPAFWGYYSKEYAHPFVVDGGNTFAQCIPYEGNEYLLGKTDDCDEFYKTWEE